MLESFDNVKIGMCLLVRNDLSCHVDYGDYFVTEYMYKMRGQVVTITGMEMDIKCCGVQFVEGTDNRAWAEAVLFCHGSEVNHTSIDCEFDGEWELEYNGDTYITYVIQEE